MPTISQDPTRQSGNRRKAIADFKRRLNAAQREINSLFDTLRVIKKDIPDGPVINKTIYEWLVDNFTRQQADDEIRRIIEKWLQTAPNQRSNFFIDYVDSAYRMGTIDAALRVKLLAEIGNLDQGVLTSLDPLVVLNQIQFRDRVQLALTQSFTQMKGFSEDTIVDIARVLTETITNGQSPRAAQRAIKKTFDTSRARAERIARTEINRSYTVARAEQNKAVRNDLGLDVRVVHRSALQFDRTRRTHGMRHGTIHTIEDQMQWWDAGTNRINCLCSMAEIIVRPDGAPVDTGLIKRLQKQRKAHYGT